MITFSPIVIGILVADGFTMQHHLRCMVRLWFQQQRVHIRMTGNACCFGLNCLGAAYLQSIRSDKRVEGHILGFEGSRLITVLSENATEGGSHDALADVAARSWNWL